MSNTNAPGLVLEKQEAKTKPPPMYQVVLLNDEKFFKMGREKATHVMLKVHREGKGVCGLFPRDIAATKVEQVCSFARQHQHPLQCVMEEA
ncbi:MAG: ATP-dependent Clp protease adapter ClpS [Betaproteobacteria bacterium]|nr:ATP-dependent Clp protease adapter ClpS [Betaproteobacteria bacterium]